MRASWALATAADLYAVDRLRLAELVLEKLLARDRARAVLVAQDAHDAELLGSRAALKALPKGQG